MGRSIVMRTLAVALAVLGTALLAEVGARMVGFAPTFERQELLVKLDEGPLYRVIPGKREDLNALGYRDREFELAKNGRTRILLVGDSFLMGLGVGIEQTLPRRLESLLGPGAQVYNMGVLGYGPDQVLVRLQEEGMALEPDVVLLSVFPANDFADLSENELFEARPDGSLARHPDNPIARLLRGPRLLLFLRRALTGEFFAPGVQAELVERLFGDGYELIEEPDSEGSRNEIAIMRGVFRAFKELTDAAEVRFGVIVIPSYENIQNDANFRRKNTLPRNYFANERIAIRLCDELGIGYINLAVPFLQHRKEGLYSEKDRHLSVRGHELAAQTVADSLSP